MWMIFKLALRNLWRNRRRTIITSASVMVAAFFAIAMSSFQKGTWQNTLEGMLHNYTGYIQVHAKGYWENQSIDLLMTSRPAFLDSITAIPGVNLTMERLENFALVSTGPKTKGVLIVGVDPDQAHNFSGIKNQIKEGTFIEGHKNEAILGKNLADLLGQKVGDTLVTISQGYRANNAVGQYRISGIVDFGNPIFNKQMVYIPLTQAQDFYAAPNMISSLVLTTKNIDQVEAVKESLINSLDTSKYEIMDFQELVPSIIEGQAIDTASSKIILSILYILIGFGILGTVMMMLKERQYEFGVLKAIGMKSRQLFFMIFIEILAIGILGAAAGMTLAAPLVLYFNLNPIHLGGGYGEVYEKFNLEPLMKTAVNADIFVAQAIVVFIMVALISLHPFFSLRKLKPAEAMRA